MAGYCGINQPFGHPHFGVYYAPYYPSSVSDSSSVDNFAMVYLAIEDLLARQDTASTKH